MLLLNLMTIVAQGQFVSVRVRGLGNHRLGDAGKAAGRREIEREGEEED